ncbi:azurin [Lysobacter sp. GX 14042]|uniref:azurin n=1 Tax=Lysobacter sp. GX 14042 TaxID=2907155 RepID=UPI001F3C1E51|nr:azurin [Lysobacter sp. GX 14042]MCE7032943.1 azurin [Lysobacter sp. GX 14042]
MNIKLTLLTASCALALAACGGNDTPPRDRDTAATPPPVAGDTAPDSAMGAGNTPPAATTPPAQPAGSTGTAGNTGTDTAAPAAGASGNKPAAVVNDCSTTIEGNDAMQFDVGSITVPASCSDFTINLHHSGQLPVAAMGHNVVITRAADMQAVASAGLSAGADDNYVDPDDERVIAHTDLVGGGETTSVTFAASGIQGNGPYKFFCSFPGHSALMRGTIQVQ